MTPWPGDTPGLPFHLDDANHHMRPTAHRPAVAERLKPHRKHRNRQTAAAATATALFSYSYPVMGCCCGVGCAGPGGLPSFAAVSRWGPLTGPEGSRQPFDAAISLE